MLTPLLQLAGLAKKWPTFTAEEIEKHHTRNSLWIVAGDSVYDVTRLLGSHPGGDGALLRRGGGTKDCTEDFLFHGRVARQDAEKYKIGVVDPKSKLDFAAIASRRAAAMRAAVATARADCQQGHVSSDAGSRHSSLLRSAGRPDGEMMSPGACVAVAQAESGPSFDEGLFSVASSMRQCTKDADVALLGKVSVGPNHDVLFAAASPVLAECDGSSHCFEVSDSPGPDLRGEMPRSAVMASSTDSCSKIECPATDVHLIRLENTMVGL